LRVPIIKNAAHEDDTREYLNDESLYQTMVSYIYYQHRTDFEFWRKAVDVKKSLSVLDDDSLSYCNYDFSSQNAVNSSVAVAICRELGFAACSAVARAALEIGSHSRWLPFLTWMAEILESVEPTALTMYDWWRSTGASFCFMDQPPEIRGIVYGHLLGPYTWPHDIEETRNFEDEHGDDILVRVFRPTTSHEKWPSRFGYWQGREAHKQNYYLLVPSHCLESASSC
jgi:hypothetical protein